MDTLQKMLFERYHPRDIMSYIHDNYKTLTKDHTKEFNESIIEPENGMVQRYDNMTNVGTMRYLIKKTFDLKGKLEFYPQFIFNSDKTSLFIDNVPNFTLNLKNKNIRLYRITACSVLIEGGLTYEQQYYENKKIVYYPRNFDYRYMNLFDNNELPIQFESKGCIVSIYQHVEYIPIKKCANCKLNKEQIKLHDDILKNKVFEITNYDVDKFISKVQKEYS